MDWYGGEQDILLFSLSFRSVDYSETVYSAYIFRRSASNFALLTTLLFNSSLFAVKNEVGVSDLSRSIVMRFFGHF